MTTGNEPRGRFLLKRRLLFLGQATVSAGLLLYLVLKIDVVDAISTIFSANPWLLLASVAQLAIQLALVTVRWSIIATSMGASLPIVLGLRFVWIGAFFSQILPGSVSGDLLRIWLFWTKCKNRRIAVYSVTLERVLMLAMLLVVVLASQPGLAARGVPFVYALAAASMLAAILVFAAALVLSAGWLRTMHGWWAIRVLSHAADDLRGLLLSRSRAAVLLMLSLASYLNMAIAMWLIARALDFGVSIADCIVLVPLIVLATTLPISVGGWGVREGAAIVLFGLIGLPRDSALVLSVLFGFSAILATLPGSWLWIARDRRHAVSEMPADAPPHK